MNANLTPSPADDHHTPPKPLPEGPLRRWPWLTFLGPFVVYMLVGSFEPAPPRSFAPPPGDQSPENQSDADQSPDKRLEQTTPNPFLAAERAAYLRYPLIYSVKILLTLCAMAYVWPGYRTFTGKLSPWSVVVGVVGVVLWIALCQLNLEPIVLAPLGLADYFRELGQRPAFNPLVELRDQPAWAFTFLAIRFVGLAAVVPMIEEFFLRGFVMRIVVHDQWERVPFGTATTAALIAGTAVPMLMHPGELFASLVWFSLVSWLMVRTRNIWDCVVAHAITNFLLGVYVVTVNTPASWQLM